VESSLAQILYENIKPYGLEGYRLNKVLQTVQEMAKQRRAEIPLSEVYVPLAPLAARQVEKEATANLKRAEAVLENLKNQPSIISIVDNRIYVETLEAGSGEIIGSQDIVEIQFKEYDAQGTLIKDTSDMAPFTIPLSQTIKGFQLAIKGMRVGERRKIHIHPEYGFGKINHADPNRLLVYEVILVGKKKA
jgi:peptidylprolyl isomerase